MRVLSVKMASIYLFISFLFFLITQTLAEDDGPFPIHQGTVFYWVDPTCTAKPRWNEISGEAFNFAKRAAERLSSAGDTDFANVFATIFNVNKDDQTQYKRSAVFRDMYDNQDPDEDQDEANGTNEPNPDMKATAYDMVFGMTYPVTPQA